MSVHPYLEDIWRQPEALRHVGDFFTSDGRSTLAAVRQWLWRGEHHLIVFTGLGSALHAAEAVVPSLTRIGLRAVASDASELLYYGIPSLAGKVAVVVVSPSGEEEEIRALVKALKGRVPLLGVVQDDQSFLAAAADQVVRVPVPLDRYVPVMAYTATVAALLLVAHVVAGGIVDRAAALLAEARDGMESLLEGGMAAGDAIASLIEPHTLVHVTGRGPSTGSALEGAHLLGTVAKQHAHGLSIGQFRRETLDVIEQGHLTILFAPQGATFEANKEMAWDLASRRGRVAVITNGRPGGFPRAAEVISLNYPDDSFAPVVEIVPLQLAAFSLLRAGEGQALSADPVRAGD